jgi:hypothetical protein
MRLPFLVLLLILIISPITASQVYIARGDATAIQRDAPDGTCWLFSDYGSVAFYNMPSETVGDGVTYCEISKTMSYAMSPGEYTLLYQEPVVLNGKTFRDVSWVNGSLVSSISIPPIDESGKTPNLILKDLKSLISTNKLNTYSEVTIHLQDPYLKVSELGRTGESIYTVKGTSNFADDTSVTIKIDDTRYFAQHDDSFTYKTVVERPAMDMDGTWEKEMFMPIQNMTPGWHNLSVIAGELRTEAMFKIEEQEWGPRPTPTQFIKYLSNGNIAPVIVTVTVVQPPVTIYQDRWHTATPTPDITDALGQKVEYPYSSGEVIPGWVGIGCLCLIGLIVLVRDRKWKK